MPPRKAKGIAPDPGPLSIAASAASNTLFTGAKFPAANLRLPVNSAGTVHGAPYCPIYDRETPPSHLVHTATLELFQPPLSAYEKELQRDKGSPGDLLSRGRNKQKQERDILSNKAGYRSGGVLGGKNSVLSGGLQKGAQKSDDAKCAHEAAVREMRIGSTIPSICTDLYSSSAVDHLSTHLVHCAVHTDPRNRNMTCIKALAYTGSGPESVQTTLSAYSPAILIIGGGSVYIEPIVSLLSREQKDALKALKWHEMHQGDGDYPHVDRQELQDEIRSGFEANEKFTNRTTIHLSLSGEAETAVLLGMGDSSTGISEYESSSKKRCIVLANRRTGCCETRMLVSPSALSNHTMGSAIDNILFENWSTVDVDPDLGALIGLCTASCVRSTCTKDISSADHFNYKNKNTVCNNISNVDENLHEICAKAVGGMSYEAVNYSSCAKGSSLFNTQLMISNIVSDHSKNLTLFEANRVVSSSDLHNESKSEYLSSSHNGDMNHAHTDERYNTVLYAIGLLDGEEEQLRSLLAALPGGDYSSETSSDLSVYWKKPRLFRSLIPSSNVYRGVLCGIAPSELNKQHAGVGSWPSQQSVFLHGDPNASQNSNTSGSRPFKDNTRILSVAVGTSHCIVLILDLLDGQSYCYGRGLLGTGALGPPKPQPPRVSPPKTRAAANPPPATNTSSHRHHITEGTHVTNVIKGRHKIFTKIVIQKSYHDIYNTSASPSYMVFDEISCLSQKGVQSVYASGNLTLAVTCSGYIFALGELSGTGTDGKAYRFEEPTVVLRLHPQDVVLDVAIGASEVFILVQGNRIYQMRNNNNNHSTNQGVNMINVLGASDPPSFIDVTPVILPAILESLNVTRYNQHTHTYKNLPRPRPDKANCNDIICRPVIRHQETTTEDVSPQSTMINQNDLRTHRSEQSKAGGEEGASSSLDLADQRTASQLDERLRALLQISPSTIGGVAIKKAICGKTLFDAAQRLYDEDLKANAPIHISEDEKPETVYSGSETNGSDEEVTIDYDENSDIDLSETASTQEGYNDPYVEAKSLLDEGLIPDDHPTFDNTINSSKNSLRRISRRESRVSSRHGRSIQVLGETRIVDRVVRLSPSPPFSATQLSQGESNSVTGSPFPIYNPIFFPKSSNSSEETMPSVETCVPRTNTILVTKPPVVPKPQITTVSAANVPLPSSHTLQGANAEHKPYLNTVRLTTLKCGKEHWVVQDATSSILFGWGSNTFGQLFGENTREKGVLMTTLEIQECSSVLSKHNTNINNNITNKGETIRSSSRSLTSNRRSVVSSNMLDHAQSEVMDVPTNVPDHPEAHLESPALPILFEAALQYSSSVSFLSLPSQYPAQQIDNFFDKIAVDIMSQYEKSYPLPQSTVVTCTSNTLLSASTLSTSPNLKNNITEATGVSDKEGQLYPSEDTICTTITASRSIHPLKYEDIVIEGFTCLSYSTIVCIAAIVEADVTITTTVSGSSPPEGDPLQGNLSSAPTAAALFFEKKPKDNSPSKLNGQPPRDKNTGLPLPSGKIKTNSNNNVNTTPKKQVSSPTAQPKEHASTCLSGIPRSHIQTTSVVEETLVKRKVSVYITLGKE